MAQVTVYSSPTCPHCKHTKEFLRKHDIDFDDIDVTSDRAKLDEMKQKSGQMGVPVVMVDGKVIVGFNEGELRKALNLTV